MKDEADLEAARRRIRAAYDPELLRNAGHRLIDLLADHLDKVQRRGGKVLPWRDPEANVRQASEILDESLSPDAPREALAGRLAGLVQTMLHRGLNLHHPRYIGHQVPAPAPVAGLFDAVGAVTNQVMAIYEMGPWATAAEFALVDRLGRQIGWTPGQFGGLATHGGSLANLTALLTARNVRLDRSWERGLGGAGPAPALVVNADAHYSVARAAGVLGLGTEHIVRVGLDSRRRMDPQRLDETLTRLRDQGRPVAAVTACACATPIGAFDPLNDIAQVCRRHDVWLHVDGAHGASACMSAKHRHLVAGLEQADSVVWDAHKMLFVPGLCAFVLYREAGRVFDTFRQEAPYLFDPAAPGLAAFDSGLRTFECTKRAAAFGLWGLWSLFGPQLFADLVDVTFDLGRRLHARLEAAPDFQPLHEPQCNIVVFRHAPAGLRRSEPAQVGAFQLELRRRLVESGSFYIVSTDIDGVGALRVTLINPLTTDDDLDELLEALREAGRQLLDGA